MILIFNDGLDYGEDSVGFYDISGVDADEAEKHLLRFDPKGYAIGITSHIAWVRNELDSMFDMWKLNMTLECHRYSNQFLKKMHLDCYAQYLRFINECPDHDEIPNLKRNLDKLLTMID